MSKQQLEKYINYFNSLDDERYSCDISNKEAFSFLEQNIPLLDCPDKNLELTYYFRWWAFRKHIKNTTEGRVITEFFPEVPWAGKYNTINMSAGCHILDGRWLRDTSIMEEYIKFWYSNPKDTINYTSWISDSAYRYGLLTGKTEVLETLLTQMIECYYLWEKGFIYKEKHEIGRKENGLYRTIDDREGSECSIGGHGYRPLLNSVMFSHASTIATIAKDIGNKKVFQEYTDKAKQLKKTYMETCWNEEKSFFTVLKDDGSTLVDVCELYGYAPWFFNMIENRDYDQAWGKVMDKNAFFALHGLTYAEQSHKEFALNYTGHHCQWNGPSWPMTTSFTIEAISRMLQSRDCVYVDREDYCSLLSIYANSHRRLLEDGSIIPWIDENLHPYTGDWISRTIINTQPGERYKGQERGREYNHSTFCDLVLGGLIGIVPNKDDSFSVLPMVSERRWSYFRVSNLFIKGKNVEIVYDKDGSMYELGKGFFVMIEGKIVVHKDGLADLHNIILG